VPRRLEDGYDLGSAGVHAAVEAGVGVVVTCDCGTSAWEAVASLKLAGVDVIITDHHLPPSAGVPPALAVINPRQAGCLYPDKDLAGVGVAFKLAQQLVKRFGANENIVMAHLDLVALATVADVAPLRGENRVLSRAGLKLISETKKAGLRALLRSAGIADKPITAGRIGFILAPRLNAVGRLGHAMRGVELLMSSTDAEANVIARELEEMNRTRQEIDRGTLQEARDMLNAAPSDELCGIVLASEDWHPGVVGIVASRIVEGTGRPTVLIAIADGVGKGSGRSIPAFDLHSGLGECSDLFLRYGGHRAAAGVTIRPELIPEFARRFNEIARLKVRPEDFLPQLRIDLEINFQEWDLEEVEKYLRHFEPFGPSNPGPVFAAMGVEVSRPPRKVGESGLRFSVRSGSRSLDLLSWSHYPRRDEIAVGRRVDVAFRLERDEWNGADRLQGRLLDFRGA
jgi:single-stranded-DNA-specific exonuclease